MPLPRLAPIPGEPVRGPRPVDYAVCCWKKQYNTYREAARVWRSTPYRCACCRKFHVKTKHKPEELKGYFPFES